MLVRKQNRESEDKILQSITIGKGLRNVKKIYASILRNDF